MKARQGICNHDNLLTGKLLYTQTAGCNREIEAAEEAIQELEEQIESSADYKKHITASG